MFGVRVHILVSEFGFLDPHDRRRVAEPQFRIVKNIQSQ